MKKLLFILCLFVSAVSFSSSTSINQFHTLFLLHMCTNLKSFESSGRVDFLKSISSIVDFKKEDSEVLTNKHLLYQGSLITGLTSIKTKGCSIFCTTQPVLRKVTVDIYSDEINFDREALGKICQDHFEAKSYSVSYPNPE